MAFKTREERAALRAKETPYTIDDLRFRGKKIHRVVVALSSERRGGGFNEEAHPALINHKGKDERIAVVFAGKRLDDFKKGRLEADFDAEHQRNCAKEDFHSSISRELIVEGFWKTRNFKDPKGNWHKSWELHAAKWHYSPDGETGFVEEGALPSFD